MGDISVKQGLFEQVLLLCEFASPTVQQRLPDFCSLIPKRSTLWVVWAKSERQVCTCTPCCHASSTLQILQLCLCYIFPWLQTATILIGLADYFFNPFYLLYFTL